MLGDILNLFCGEHFWYGLYDFEMMTYWDLVVMFLIK